VAAGLKNGYINTQVAAGSTDVGAIALAIQKSGVNGIYLPIVVSTAFSLFAALKQLGVKLKVAMIATGYGGDLLASSAAVQAGQGYLFTSIGQPVEMHTPATEKQVTALAAVGVTTTPTFAEQESYIAGAAVAAGLRARTRRRRRSPRPCATSTTSAQTACCHPARSTSATSSSTPPAAAASSPPSLKARPSSPSKARRSAATPSRD
jgi:ABC-type branched-subunit amino acid transport system substrate-binding protein